MPLNVQVLEKSFDIITTLTTEFVASIYTNGNVLEQVDRQKEAQYCSFFENAVVGMFQATLDGNYLTANPMLARIYGYRSPSELIDITNIKEQLYVAPNRYAQLMQLLQNEASVCKFESQIYRQDGSIIWISENIRAIYDSHGKLVIYEGTVEDITQRKHDELELKAELENQKEIVNLKSNFLSMVCHDLRASLTVILATSDLLKLHSQKMTQPDRFKYLNKIGLTVKNMTDMLEGFLAIGKAEAGIKELKTDTINLQAFCQEIWQDVQVVTNATHQLNFSSNCNQVTLVAEKTILRQIFMNLLWNAVKYSPQGSQIEFNLSYAKGKTIFRIKDRGMGIAKEDIKHLFEVFHRGKNALNLSGTGLGLAIVKRAVELHSGTISVESEIGVGTTFTVTLPIIKCNPIKNSDREPLTFCVSEGIS